MKNLMASLAYIIMVISSFSVKAISFDANTYYTIGIKFTPANVDTTIGAFSFDFDITSTVPLTSLNYQYIKWGTNLGDPVTQAIVPTVNNINSINLNGLYELSVNLYEISLLEASANNCVFCIANGPYLDNLQHGNSFVLASLTFYASDHVSVDDISINNKVAVDPLGYQIPTLGYKIIANSPAAATVDEPSSIFLTLAGLLLSFHIIGNRRRIAI